MREMVYSTVSKDFDEMRVMLIMQRKKQVHLLCALDVNIEFCVTGPVVFCIKGDFILNIHVYISFILSHLSFLELLSAACWFVKMNKHHSQILSNVTNNKSLFCIQDVQFFHFYETKKVSTQDMSSRYDVHENLHTFPYFQTFSLSNFILSTISLTTTNNQHPRHLFPPCVLTFCHCWIY